MLRQLNLTALRAFEAATRTGSFRTAADDLGLTPSAVSHAIRGLERDLGTVLFEREGRSIRLTPEGETLMRHVERGFGELQLGIGSIAARKPQLLKLHCAPSFAATWLVPRLRRMLTECAGLELRLATGTDYTKFLADEFDADIVYGSPSPDYYGALTQQGVVVLPLGSEVVTPLCAPTLASAIGSPRDLLGQTLIESDNKKVRWPDWFAANGLAAPVSRGPRFDRSFMSLSAAVDELGVALESTLLAERELASGRLVRPLEGRCEDVTYTGHWIVFPRAKRYARSMGMFLSWLERELGLHLDLGSAGPTTAAALVETKGSANTPDKHMNQARGSKGNSRLSMS
jgi:LysR family transcriptional regulator, glycine cleavage system transcriptional activator